MIVWSQKYYVFLYTSAISMHFFPYYFLHIPYYLLTTIRNMEGYWIHDWIRIWLSLVNEWVSEGGSKGASISNWVSEWVRETENCLVIELYDKSGSHLLLHATITEGFPCVEVLSPALLSSLARILLSSQPAYLSRGRTWREVW